MALTESPVGLSCMKPVRLAWVQVTFSLRALAPEGMPHLPVTAKSRVRIPMSMGPPLFRSRVSTSRQGVRILNLSPRPGSVLRSTITSTSVAVRRGAEGGWTCATLVSVGAGGEAPDTVPVAMKVTLLPTGRFTFWLMLLVPEAAVQVPPPAPAQVHATFWKSAGKVSVTFAFLTLVPVAFVTLMVYFSPDWPGRTRAYVSSFVMVRLVAGRSGTSLRTNNTQSLPVASSGDGIVHRSSPPVWRSGS